MRSAAGIVCALLAIAYFAARPAPSRGPLPNDVHALAARIEAHPADWLAASALAERALDAPVRDPLALWHASGSLAIALAPALPPPRASFARAGFFHWNELSAADRRAVLETYVPVLREPFTFAKMAAPLFALTGDFEYLRRAHPHAAASVRELILVAGTNGRFDDYRALRDEMETLDPSAMPSARVATIEPRSERALAITLKTIQSDDVPPYVEIYADGVRRAEGTVSGQQTFTVPVAGVRQIEVRLANPYTRNSGERKVRVTETRAL